MRILHVSDIHGNQRWLDWLIAGAPTHDLLVVAGDMQDHWNEEQVPALKDWIKRVPGQTAFCSGNHDSDELRKLLRGRPNIFPDRFNGMLQGIWVTVAPFHWEVDTVINVGIAQMLRTAQAAKPWNVPWVLVHHVPPPGPLADVGIQKSDTGMTKWLERFPIDFAFCGHGHHEPARSARCCEKVGSCWVFNPGQSQDAPIPNYVLLDTIERSGVWHVDGTEQVFQV